MGSSKMMFLLNTHFGFVNIGYFSVILYRKMVLFGGVFWVFLCHYVHPLFRFIVRNLFRFHVPKSNCLLQENIKTDSSCIDQKHELVEYESKLDEIGTAGSKQNDTIKEESSSTGYLKFRFLTYEEFSKSLKENDDFVKTELSGSTSIDRFEAMVGKSFSSFIEEQEKVEDSCFDSKYDSGIIKEDILNDGFLLENDFVDQNVEIGDVPEKLQNESTSINRFEVMVGKRFSSFIEEQEKVEDSCFDSKYDSGIIREEILNDGFLLENDFVDQNAEIGDVLEKLQNESSSSFCKEKFVEKTDFSTEVQFHSEEFTVDSESTSTSSSHGFSVTNHLVDSNSNEFLCERDFEVDIDTDIDTMMNNEEGTRRKSTQSSELMTIYDESDSEVMEDFKNLETETAQELNSGFLSEKDFKIQKKEFVAKPNSKKWPNREPDDLNGLETLWEHQELIEQLKMELKKVKATGLPTIFEDSESPKIVEDFQPWKIEEKFQHEDTMDELHKIYRSYRERMRKFDILNYQKMYALGFLQAKDPLQSVSSSSSASTKLIFFENLLLWKPNKKSETDPTVKFIKELYSDLEMVYVGQMCLSWEFLYWQYEKALELWESDPRRIHVYNEVSCEFQQFHVLMQRFIENQAFQGPRVQNYVKNRCVLRNLLQVPVIREDNVKGKRRGRRRDESDITSDRIIEIIEESIRVFWHFVRSDKHRKDTHTELQDPADSELLIEVRTSLQKKEKRLNDILRTGNCILKRFQKNQDESGDPVLYFFSEVDMKLVARVLSMSRITTEQLVWCHSKLKRISFVNRRIHVDSSFLLFPC